MLPQAQLVAVPYQAILHKKTRHSLGIKLEGNPLVFDEAHNVIDAVNSVHSATLAGGAVSAASQQLSSYVERYKGRLSASNMRYASQVLRLLGALNKALAAPIKSKGAVLYSLNDFLFEYKIDHFNLFEVEEWFSRSLIVRKLQGFIEQAAEPTDGIEQRGAMRQVEALLMALNNSDGDGHLFVTLGEDGKKSIRYVMLNAAVNFEELIGEAAAVVLAGGTLKPTNDLLCQLTPNLDTKQLHTISCDHVVPPDHLCTLAVSRGPSNTPFDFTFEGRKDLTQLDELGRLLLNVCRAVPHGVVVFLPSYAFEAQAHARWKQSGILQQLSAVKKVFREEQGAGSADRVLAQYSAEAVSAKGALLTCTMGGKMSEGINFSDELGRCILVVGLPYPSSVDPVLQQKMKYFDQRAAVPGSLSISGKEYYENLCMKAVNQAIGRSIRHIKDYSSILLVDQRYSRPSVIQKLPLWISRGVVTTHNFGQAFGLLHKFFRRIKSLQLKPLEL